MVVFAFIDSSSLAHLETKVGYYFRNRASLEEAMSHDSLRGTNRNIRDYQRYEYLGDAVIHFIVTNYVFKKYPNANEGDLSSIRSNLVSGRAQREIADRLELQKFVRMSPGVREFLRYDKFVEALIGAIFLDAGGEVGGGYAAAKQVIYKLWNLEEPGGQGCVIS